MPLSGTLNTMPLTDVLQWISAAQRSGRPFVKGNEVCIKSHHKPRSAERPTAWIPRLRRA